MTGIQDAANFDPYGYAMTSANAVDDLMQKINAQAAAKQAGQAYANGDPSAAAQILARSGNIGGSQQFQDTQQTIQEKSQDIADQRGDYAAKQYARAHALIGESHDALQSAYDNAEKQQPGSGGQALAQAFNSIPWGAAGVNPQQQQIATQKALTDPQGFLAATAQAAPKLTWKQSGDDIYGLDESGNTVKHLRGGRIVVVNNGTGGQTVMYYNPGSGEGTPLSGSAPGAPIASAGSPGTPPGGGVGGPAGGPPTPAGALPASAPPPAPPTGTPPPETVQGGMVMPASFEQAIRGQEAPAGQAGAGVAGPVTPYGQAHGTFQVMDATGQALAQKLGIAWRPDLMRANTPEGKQYQDAIGHAATQDAWAHGGGDPASAAGYYYAGPDHKLWGPKTHAYQQAIVGRMGADTGTSQTAAATVGQPSGLTVTRAPDGTPVYTTAPRPAAPGAHPSTAAELQAIHLDPNTAGAQTDAHGMVHLLPGGDAASSSATSITPQGVSLLAETMLANGGKVPSNLGMGKSAAGMKALVINEAARLATVRGITPLGVVNQGLTRHADAQALNGMTKAQGLINASEETANKSADLFSRNIGALGGTNYPLLNKAIVSFKRNTGNPAVDAAIAQLGTFRDEYAKVIAMNPSGGGGSGATDAVRSEVTRRIGEAQSPAQLKAVIDSMRQEMSYRSASFQDGIDTIKGRLGGGSPSAPQPSMPRGASRWTQEQVAAQKPFIGSSARAGSRQNPLVPVTQTQYDRIPPGTFIIDQDGKVGPKPGRAVSAGALPPGWR